MDRTGMRFLYGKKNKWTIIEEGSRIFKSYLFFILNKFPSIVNS